jgi:hypothetical protein
VEGLKTRLVELMAQIELSFVPAFRIGLELYHTTPYGERYPHMQCNHDCLLYDPRIGEAG